MYFPRRSWKAECAAKDLVQMKIFLRLAKRLGYEFR